METFRIIHTNDIHSKYDEFLRMAEVINSLKNQNCLLLDAGDFNDFSSFVTYGSKGYAGLKLLNILGYDALCIGNNEGFQPIETIEKMCSYDLIDIISCNIVKTNNQKIKNLKPFVIKKIKDKRFLIIGVSPYLDSYNVFYNFYDLKALEPLKIIKEIIKDNQGKYDFIIILSHLGLKADIMLSQSLDNIDIIISGHSHHVLDCIKVNNTYISQSGVRGSHVGYLDFKIVAGKLELIKDENIKIDLSNKENSLIKENYLMLKETALKQISIPVIDVFEDLNYKEDQECNFTNLIADYLYINYSSDFALINSGLTACNLKKKKISIKELLEVCNSPLNVSCFEVLGKDIMAALKESLNKEKCFENRRRAGFRGTFLGKLHVSYNCLLKNNNGNLTLFINGIALDENKYYKIVSTDYFYRGMGYEILKNNVNGIIYKETIEEVIKNALKDSKYYKYINKFRLGGSSENV